MGDFPAVINLIKFQEEVEGVTSTFIGTLAYSPNGAGNAVVVPMQTYASGPQPSRISRLTLDDLLYALRSAVPTAG